MLFPSYACCQPASRLIQVGLKAHAMHAWDCSPSPHSAPSPRCILLVLLLSLSCSSSPCRSRELCAGAGHSRHSLKPSGYAVAQPRREDTAGSISQLSPPQGRTTCSKARTPCLHPRLSLRSPTPGWGFRRAAGITRAQHRQLLPASPLLPTWCYSLYKRSNKSDKTSPRRLLQKALMIYAGLTNRHLDTMVISTVKEKKNTQFFFSVLSDL